MKLYDYARRINKSLKDKQWDWADEEFRRIWDVLYNKREQYSNQVPPATVTSDPSSFFINNKTFAYLNGFGQTRASESGLFSAVGGLVSSSEGTPVASNADDNSTAPAKDIDETFPYATLVTTTAADNTRSIKLCGSTTNTGLCYAIQLPRAIFIVRTLDSISDRIIHIGLAGDPRISTANVASGSEHLPSTVSGAFYNAFTLFYKPVAIGGSQTSANWQVCHRYQTQSASFVDTGVVVETNKAYQIEIVFTQELGNDEDGFPILFSKYDVYINNNKVFGNNITAPSGSNFPDNAKNISSTLRKLVPFVWQRNHTVGTVRAFGVQKIFMEWGYPISLTDYKIKTWNQIFGLIP